MRDVEYSEGDQEERGGPGSEMGMMTDQLPLKGVRFNQSEAEDSQRAAWPRIEPPLGGASVREVRTKPGDQLMLVLAIN